MDNPINTQIEEIKNEVIAWRESNDKLMGNVVTKDMLEDLQAHLLEKAAEVAEQKAETIANRPNRPQTQNQPSEAKAAFCKYLATGEFKANAELVLDDSGAVMVPEELISEIYTSTPTIKSMRNLVTVRPVQGDKLRKRSLTDVTVGWGRLESGTSMPGATGDATPSEAYIYTEDVNGLIKLGEDLREDVTNLENTVAGLFGEAIGNSVDSAICNGRGHTTYEEPEGILSTGAGVTTVTSASSASLDLDDLIAVQYALGAEYRANASWAMDSTIELATRLLKADWGYVWQPSGIAGTPATLLGSPIYNQDDMPTWATGAKVAIYGDFRRGYILTERRPITVQRLSELYAESGQIGIRVKARVGGGVVRAAAFRILEVD